MITEPRYSDFTGQREKDKFRDININNTAVAVSNESHFFLNISRGLIDGHGREFKFGRHPGVGLAEEVIWDGEGNYTFLEADETLNIVSTSTDDTLLGDGARTLLVVGLDSDFNEIQEIIEMDGTNNVLTTNSYFRINRMIVLTSGTNTPIGDSNLGDITAITSGLTILQAKILIGNGQTLMAVYTVPVGKTVFATGLSFSVPDGKSCLFKVKFRNGPGVPFSFSVKFTADLFQQAINLPLTTPFPVPEKTDIVITGKSSAVGTPASASFGLVLINN